MQADLKMSTSSSAELSAEDHLAAVVKRKRTKRPRHHPPASPASSSESTTTEEEDMAHCLILLAQGAAVDSKPSPSPAPPPEQTPPLPAAVVKAERYTSRKYTEAATTADGGRAGFYVYECKTCNKCFPTFQALGGHRASHKKPRLAGAGADDDSANASTVTIARSKPPTTSTPSPPQPHQLEAAAAPADVTTALSLHNGGAGSISKLRVHECSICGAEFASGQALGGHMRRHRPLNPPERAVTKKDGSASINLELDLNLPAPSDEESVSHPPPPPPPTPMVLGLSQFNDGNKGGLMLTASAALVDCHF